VVHLEAMAIVLDRGHADAAVRELGNQLLEQCGLARVLLAAHADDRWVRHGAPPRART